MDQVRVIGGARQGCGGDRETVRVLLATRKGMGSEGVMGCEEGEVRVEGRGRSSVGWLATRKVRHMDKAEAAQFQRAIQYVLQGALQLAAHTSIRSSVCKQIAHPPQDSFRGCMMWYSYGRTIQR